MSTRKGLLRLVLGWWLPAISCLPLPAVLVAQDPGQAAPVEANKVRATAPGLGRSPEKEVASARHFRLLNLYAIEIIRIDIAVKLDDSQRANLHSGAKQIAKDTALELARSMDSSGRGGVLPVGGAAPLPSKPQATEPPVEAEPPVELQEIASYAQVGWETKLVLEGGFLYQPDHRENAHWKTLVKSVLTPAQYAKLEQTLPAQQQLTEKTIIDAGIIQLEVELLLTPEQARKLAALAMEQVAKNGAPIEAQQPRVSLERLGLRLSFLRELAKVDAQQLRDVLDPQQFELLEFKLEPLRQFAADMAPAGMIVP